LPLRCTLCSRTYPQDLHGCTAHSILSMTRCSTVAAVPAASLMRTRRVGDDWICIAQTRHPLHPVCCGVCLLADQVSARSRHALILHAVRLHSLGTISQSCNPARMQPELVGPKATFCAATCSNAHKAELCIKRRHYSCFHAHTLHLLVASMEARMISPSS
jgi:hypothetical protein